MKTRTRILSLIMALLTVFGVMYIPAITAASAEATLTVTPEGGTATSSSGTYNEMHAKLATELEKNPTVKTKYVLTLNTNAAYTSFKELKGDTNCDVTVDLNGYTLNVTNLKNNIYTITGAITFTLDGANAKGERGLIHNDGICGAIAFVKSSATADASVTVQNLEMYYTKMDQGYSVSSQYPNQPMCNVGIGDLTFKNVKMTFTGANSVSNIEGTAISSMTTDMIRFSGGGNLTIDGCEIIDTNTKKIKVKCLNVSGSSNVSITDTKIQTTNIALETPNKGYVYAKLKDVEIKSDYRALSLGKQNYIQAENIEIDAYMPFWNNASKIYVYDSKITSRFASQGNGTYLFNCEYYSETGNIGDPAGANHQVHFMPSPNGENVIHTAATVTALNGAVSGATGWAFNKVEDSKWVFSTTETLDATLVIVNSKGSPTYTTGTADELIANIANISSITADTICILTLYKDTALASAKTMIGNPFAKIVIDLNGYNMDVSAIKNNIFTLQGAASQSTVGGMNFNIDGANADGTKIGKITSTSIAGGLVYSRNTNSNENSVITVQNLEMYYTNLSQGFYDTASIYPNQPMFNFSKGDITLKNVKMTYTGADATAVVGSAGSANGNISDMKTPMIDFGGKSLTIDGCEIIDTNTKGIQTRAVNANNGSGKVYIKNSTLSAYMAIVSASTVTAYIENSTLTGKNTTLYAQGKTYVTDSTLVAPAALAPAVSENIFFLYGTGKNEIQSASALDAIGYKTTFAQKGYVFESAGTGVYKMKEDTSVEASLVIAAEGASPEFFTGTFNEMYAKLNVKPEVKTEFIITLNKDATYTYKAIDTNSNAYITMNFNGKQLTYRDDNNMFQITGNYHLTINGKDANGNPAKVLATGKAGSLVYPRANNGLNDNTVIVISDLVMTYTNLSMGFSNNNQYTNQQIFHIAAGDVTLNNLDITYTGEDASTLDAVNKPLTSMTTHLVQANAGAKLTLNNCKIKDTNTKGIPTKALVAGGTVIANNCEIVGGETVNAYNSGSAQLNNCTVTSSKIAYNGYNITVTDTQTNITGELAGTQPVIFKYGTGKNEVITDGTLVPSGNIVAESGYVFVRASETKWIISDGTGYLTVKLPAIFQSGMVFQRNKPINVFGTCATDGATVTVKLGDNTKQATVANGEWKVTFDAMDVTKGLTLTIDQSGVNEYADPIELTDIAVGEVWVVSGQSNAEFESYKMEDFEEYKANANNFNNIRAFIADHDTATQKTSGSGVWVKVTADMFDKENVTSKGDIPAIAYIMATRLAAELGDDIPIAIVNASYNGTNIQSWINPEFYPAVGERWRDNEVDGYYAYKEFYDANGRYPTSAAECSAYLTRMKGLTCGNYFGMLSFMEGYEVKGVLWYQGCSNNEFGDTYYTYLEAMKKTLRKNFDDDNLPILVFQLHPNGTYNTQDTLASQSKTAFDDKNCYVVSVFNEGTLFEATDYNSDTNYDANVFVHPSRKSPLGHRAADIILENVYKIAEYDDAGVPEVEKVEASGSSVVITFNQNLCTEYDVAPTGFEIAGADGVFYKATAVLSGNKITLTASEVTAPVTVRYGYGDVIIELEDGTLVHYNSSIAAESTMTLTGSTIVTPDGTFEFAPDKNNVIRTKYNGNLYGISGHAVAIFKLDVGFTAAA